MTNNDFYKQKQAAEQVMREMNARATNNGAKSETTVTANKNENSHTAKALPPKTEPAFSLDKLLKDSDTSLILGLLLILFSENADKRLLFALIYILL